MDRFYWKITKIYEDGTKTSTKSKYFDTHRLATRDLLKFIHVIDYRTFECDRVETTVEIKKEAQAKLGGKKMSEEDLKYYFVQYWSCTNPLILMMDDLKKVLFDIYCEVEKTIPLNFENRLEILGIKYKERILKGKNYA